MAEMRRLQRQMKGVKLQYIAENDTVFFDDVAGIGEAKVCSTNKSGSLSNRTRAVPLLHGSTDHCRHQHLWLGLPHEGVTTNYNK